MVKPNQGRKHGRLAVIGGCGRVGLPFALKLAEAGDAVTAMDIDGRAVASVSRGVMPFIDHGSAPVLRRLVDERRLVATTRAEDVTGADAVIIVVATDLSADGEVQPHLVSDVVDDYAPHFRNGQLIIVRSTIAAGTISEVEKSLIRRGLDVEVVYCPDRALEGQSDVELLSLPQIVGARSEAAFRRAAAVLSDVVPSFVQVTPEEAEFAKLIANAWRFTTFSLANEFHRVLAGHGLDYERVRRATATGYPRAADLPRAGFVGGPCLAKDTRQFVDAGFASATITRSALALNGSLPGRVVDEILSRLENDRRTAAVGVLGAGFKPGSDDRRQSLASSLIPLLREAGVRVLVTDPWVEDDDILPLTQVLAEADLLVVATMPGPRHS